MEASNAFHALVALDFGMLLLAFLLLGIVWLACRLKQSAGRVVAK